MTPDLGVLMAGCTRLELATSDVAERSSNQLLFMSLFVSV